MVAVVGGGAGRTCAAAGPLDTLQCDRVRRLRRLRRLPRAGLPGAASQLFPGSPGLLHCASAAGRLSQCTPFGCKHALGQAMQTLMASTDEHWLRLRHDPA